MKAYRNMVENKGHLVVLDIFSDSKDWKVSEVFENNYKIL